MKFSINWNHAHWIQPCNNSGTTTLNVHEFFCLISFANLSSFEKLIIFDKCCWHLPNTTLQIKLAKTITHPQPPSGGFSSSFDPQQSFSSRSVEFKFKSILTFFSKLCLFCGSGDFSWPFADFVASTQIMCFLFSLVSSYFSLTRKTDTK